MKNKSGRQIMLTVTTFFESQTRTVKKRIRQKNGRYTNVTIEYDDDQDENDTDTNKRGVTTRKSVSNKSGKNNKNGTKK